MKKNVSRRHLIKSGIIATAGLTIIPSVVKAGNYSIAGNLLRLGGPVPGDFSDPADWIKAVKALRYSAAYCPVQPGASETLIKSFRAEAQKSNGWCME